MKRFFGIFLLVWSVAIANAQVKVVDKETLMPLAMAQIQNNKGVYLGVTDAEGYIPLYLSNESALIIQHLAYEKRVVSDKDMKTGVIELTPKNIDLGEVTVKGGNRDFMRLRGYYRTMTSLSLADSTTYTLNDGMLEYYVPVNSNKGVNARVLTSKKLSFGIIEDSLYIKKNDSIYSSSGVENVSLPELSRNMLFDNKHVKRLDLALPADSVMGKYSVAAMSWKSNNLLTVSYDMLADNAKRYYHFPLIKFLFGIDFQLSDWYQTAIYQVKPNNDYGLSTLLGCTVKGKLSIKLSGKRIRRKLAKMEEEKNKSAENVPESIDGDMFTEIYFTEWEYVDKATQKANQRDTETNVEIVKPEIVPPLSEDIQKLIIRATH